MMVDPDKLIDTLLEIRKIFESFGSNKFDSLYNFNKTPLLTFLALCCNNDIGFYNKKTGVVINQSSYHDVEEFYEDISDKTDEDF